MAKSSSSRFNGVAFMLFALIVWAPVASAAINFDRLTACDDVARVYESLKSRLPARCGPPPTDVLSQVLLDKARLIDETICIEASSAPTFLDEFTCLRLNASTGSALTCVREANPSDIQVYKAQYEKVFAEKATSYRAAAAACPVSNGDSAVAQHTSLPGLLLPMSRFEFGSIMGLGQSRPSDSAIVHGYATVDPGAAHEFPAALEFVEVFVSRQEDRASYTDQKAVDDWSIGIDDTKIFDQLLGEEYRKRNMRVRFDGRSFSLERAAPEALTDAEKLELIASLQRDLGSYLEDEGFREVTDADLEEGIGMSKAEVLEHVAENQPYAWRGRSAVKYAPSLLIYFVESHPRCATNGRGAIAVYLMALQPTPNVKSDYGTINFLMAGIGDCARGSTKSTARYFTGLIHEATSQLLSSLQAM